MPWCQPLGFVSFCVVAVADNNTSDWDFMDVKQELETPDRPLKLEFFNP